jgi:hypothetical protein
MPTLSQNDLEHLKADANSLVNSAFVGVLVGHGSMILHFSNGSSVLVQCAFEAYEGGLSQTGHGESAETSVFLFPLLNEQVASVGVDAVGQMTFDFGAGRKIRIIPHNSGLESYVLRTPKGSFPVF